MRGGIKIKYKTIMPLELYLVRHGESEVNHVYDSSLPEDRRILGRNTASELTEKGKQQSRDLGKYFLEKGIKPELILSSPAVRAQQTVRYCLEEMGFEWPFTLEVTDKLAELSQGDWEGQLSRVARPPRIMQQIDRLNWYHRPPNGESLDDVSKRARSWIKEIRSSGLNRVLAFTHKNIISSLLSSLNIKKFTDIQPFERYRAYRFKLENCAVVLLESSNTKGTWKSASKIYPNTVK